MIVRIKLALADVITNAFNNKAKVRTARFNEAAENRPQRDVEVGVYHTGDSFARNGKGTYTRNYRYQIEVAIKNLRSDDEIQDTVDFIVYTLLGASIFGHEIIIDKIDNNGVDNQSIWRYTIGVTVGLMTTKDTGDCDFTTEFKFDSISINLYPSYTTPLIEE